MQTLRPVLGAALFLAAAACAALPRQASPAPPAPLIHHGFETDPGPWAGIGASSKVSLTHDAAHVKEGKGALQFDYAVNKGEINVLVLPTPDSALEKMRQLRFWIRTDYPTACAVSLQEKEGGRYTAIFSVPGTGWQEVKLKPSDFTVGEDKDDPKDPDGKLDLDKVESLAIADYGQIIAQSDNADLLALLHVQKGPHVLNIDEFTVSSEALPAAAPADPRERSLDPFDRPQLGWIGFGDVHVGVSSGKPLVGTGLRADYHQGPMKIIGLVRRIPRGRLKGMDQVAFTAVAAKPTKLVVQFEQIGGGKYRAIVDIPGGSQPKEVVLPLTAFEIAEDSGDRNGNFTPPQVNQLVILDASGLLDGADADNTLWINKLRVSPK